MKISRRLFLLWLTVVSLGLFGSAKDSPKKDYFLYVGTYTEKDSKGIYLYRYDPASSKLTDLGLAADTTNPSFLTIDSSHRFLYAVNEVSKYNGESSGAVSAFAIDPASGRLKLLNAVPTHGSDPCYISFDKTGKYLLVANYTSGNVAVLPVSPDGHVGEATSVVKDGGTLGPNKERQEAPHAHWIETSAHNRYAYVADLGLDRVLVYRFDEAKGKLSAGSGGESSNSGKTETFFSAKVEPGVGPRHVAFSANGDFMYVLGEMDSGVTVFANDSRETFRSIQHISALPAGFSGRNDAAEIAIHPNGRFLFTSNRGDDSIAVFAVDKKTGKLSYTGRFPTQGKEPRHFAIDPTGTRLFVANQNSGAIIVFTIDPKTGALTATDQTLKVPSPVCLKFMPVN